MLLLQQMMVLFIYMVIGYVACKKGIFDDRTSKDLSWLVVNIANIAMIISAAINNDGSIKGKDLITTFILAICVYAILLIIAQFIPVIFHAAEDEKGAFKVMSIFNNIGFMGYPVIAAAYGNSALLYAAVFTMIFNVLVYTYGIQTIRMDEKKGGFHLKSIINPGVISSLIALVLYVTQLPMPQFIKSTASGLSNLTGPISMMIIGVSLTRISVKDLFLDLRLLVYSFVKLLVVPILGTLLVKQFVSNQMLCQVCMVMLATPVASMTAMLAQQYQGNQMLVSKGVALTTVLSVVTIPLVSAIVF
jgi:hypothetical protein